MKRSLFITLLAFVVSACTKNGADDKDTGPDEDDSGGGGSGTLWRPAGTGTAYFLDGTADNSLFHLELTRCTDPREGEAYYGWVSRGGADAISVGEITVDNEEVYFEYDIGVNALIDGYDTFEAWATDNGGVTPDGTALWSGQIDPVIYGVIQNLLISSDATPDGEGSLRSVESSIQVIRNVAQEALDAAFVLEDFRAEAESIANALEGVEEDRNEDGVVSLIDGQIGIINDDGLIGLILADLDEATLQVDPGNPVKDYIRYAYNCTQAIEAHALDAKYDADIDSICLAESSCWSRMEEVVVGLDYALDGEDANEDGVVDLQDEGTVECAITYVSEMAQMNVTVP